MSASIQLKINFKNEKIGEYELSKLQHFQTVKNLMENRNNAEITLDYNKESFETLINFPLNKINKERENMDPILNKLILSNFTDIFQLAKLDKIELNSDEYRYLKNVEDSVLKEMINMSSYLDNQSMLKLCAHAIMKRLNTFSINKHVEELNEYLLEEVFKYHEGTYEEYKLNDKAINVYDRCLKRKNYSTNKCGNYQCFYVKKRHKINIFDELLYYKIKHLASLKMEMEY